MPKIEEPFQILGYAWLDDEEDLVWCTREELEGDTNKPADATPVVIEFYPVEQWIEKQEKDQYGALTDALSQLNQFKQDYKDFLRKQRIDNE